MGDLNGRTGLKNEVYKEVDDKFLPCPSAKLRFVNVPTRKNCDTLVNSHGNKIIDFCRTYDFMILNGRTEGDPYRNYTRMNFNEGPSTVDYGM